MTQKAPSGVACAARLEIVSIPGLPLVAPGDDLGALLVGALDGAGLALADGDVVAVASKLVSRAEGRFVALAGVAPSARAQARTRASPSSSCARWRRCRASPAAPSSCGTASGSSRRTRASI
jgi:hypothetical protein